MDINPDLDLVLERTLDAPRDIVWLCWTSEEHLPQWFVPKPHKVVACNLDLRPGGACNTTFDVDGNIMENDGVYLEVVPTEKLVFTDTYTAGWVPKADPFMTAIITFADKGNGQTAYTAVVRHRTKEACDQHRAMGFFDGWGTMTTQLDDYAQSLKQG